jgi:hypothetical protein
VSQFLTNAENIWEAAESALRCGQNPSDLTIVIGGDGAIRMLADCDWPLDSLQRHHGAQMVYRVHEEKGKLRLDGKAGMRACTFETETPRSVARRLLADSPRYCLLPAG